MTIAFTFIIYLSAALTAPSSSLAGQPLHSDVQESTSKPFWLDRTAFAHEDFLYGVGIASHSPTLEEANRVAFENGVKEIQGALQVSHLTGTGVLLVTADSYAEGNDDGTFTAYRLVSLSLREWDQYKTLKRQQLGIDKTQAQVQRDIEQREKRQIEAAVEQERRDRDKAKREGDIAWMAALEKLKEEDAAYWKERGNDIASTTKTYCPRLRLGMTKRQAEKLLGKSEIGDKPASRVYQRGIFTLHFFDGKLFSIEAPNSDRCLALSVGASEDEEEQREQKNKIEKKRKKRLQEFESKAWLKATGGKLSDSAHCFFANIDQRINKKEEFDCDEIGKGASKEAQEAFGKSKTSKSVLPPATAIK